MAIAVVVVVVAVEVEMLERRVVHTVTPGLLTVLHRAEWSPEYDRGAVIGPQPLLASKCTLKKRCGTVRPLTGSMYPSQMISQHGRPPSNRSA
jgi:hypothetical protein